MCTSVVHFNYTDRNFYLAVAFLFSEDGSTYDVSFLPRQSQSFYLQNLYNWSIFPFVVFKNYAVNRTDDPNFMFGIAQYSYADSSKTWLGHLGYQLTSWYFSLDFTIAHSPTGADLYFSEPMRNALRFGFPTGFFGTYSGNAWYKEANVFATNGFEDEAINKNRYFKCMRYSHRPLDPTPLPFF